nr:hypothetical protein [Tanacetum cinerariifolium]
MGNEEDFSDIRCVLPLVYQLMAVKKTSFPEMKCSSSIVVSVPDVVEDLDKSKKIEDASRMVSSVSILGEPIKIANALSRMRAHDAQLFSLIVFNLSLENMCFSGIPAAELCALCVLCAMRL